MKSFLQLEWEVFIQLWGIKMFVLLTSPVNVGQKLQTFSYLFSLMSDCEY